MTDFASLIRILAQNDIEFIPHKPYLRGAPSGLPFRWDADTLTRGLNFTRLRRKPRLSRRGRMRDGCPPKPRRRRAASAGSAEALMEATAVKPWGSTLITDLGAIDLLGEITGGGNYEDLLPHSLTLQLFGVPCRCLGLRRLIEVKRAAGQPRDLEVVAELEALLEESERKQGG